MFDEGQIKQRVGELADEISEGVGGERPFLIGVLSGSVVFLSDLVRRLDLDADVDFMAVSSYGGQDPSGVVRITKDLDSSIDAREVVVVEDVIDTGLTLNYLLRNLENRNPKNIRVCTLIDKPTRRIPQIELHHVGFEVEDYVVGYGLDFQGLYRNLPFILAITDLRQLAQRPGALKEAIASGDIKGMRKTR
jgi:hypoxanthine phosphoribosyltransferase